MSQLMKSISGIRGVVGDGLDPEQCARFAAAFGNYCNGGTVVLGRDTRPTGEMVRQAVVAGLMATGCTIVDIGVVPTPTVAIMVEELGADGGICITASHNPIQWNALKFFHGDGLFLGPEQAQRHLDLADRGPVYADWSRMGRLITRDDALTIHIQRILALDLLDVPALRKRAFRVALDCVNGAGSCMLPHLLQELGCDVVKIGCDGSGRFFREAEPTPENIAELSRVVAAGGFDLGIAVDPDADRLALVDAAGVPLGEEQTLALCARFVLSRRKGPVAVNVSSSAIMDDVCAEAGVPLHRTRVGEINVSLRMRETGAVIGGEGNGGVILPDLHLGRDAPVGVALVLQYLLENGIGVRALRNELPSYEMVKEKVELEGMDGQAAVDHIKAAFAGRPCDETDGLKFLQPDGRSWVQVRRSNTEPILRIFAEAPTRQAGEALVAEVRAALPTAR
jgi:phosphomannomutase